MSGAQSLKAPTRICHPRERLRETLPIVTLVRRGDHRLLLPAVRRSISRDGLAVETHGLTKRFGENVAVNGVELLVPRGCAFGYLGPNGAGKTTLIRLLLGLTHADAGTMSLLGYLVPKHRDKALARVGAIVDEPRFHGHLTGRQNLQILAAAREPGRVTVSGRPSSESVSFNAPTTVCRSTRWACVSASAWRPA